MNKGLRLLAEEIEMIKQTALETFGENIKLYIFGSRADLTKKGGDIDIYIESDRPIEIKDEIAFLSKLELRGIERKVDLVLKTPNRKDKKIYQEAKEKGVRLL